MKGVCLLYAQPTKEDKSEDWHTVCTSSTPKMTLPSKILSQVCINERCVSTICTAN